MITFFRRITKSSDGATAVMFALMVVPLIFMTGMGGDYTLASLRQAQFNSIADAAALAALKPAIISQPDAASIAAATATFNAQASTISGVNYSPGNLTVTVNDSQTVGVVKRKVTVSYTAASRNTILNVLWGPTIALGGSSQATGTTAPNIDFYLLLDDSPSMAIAATVADINTMVSNTQTQCDSPPSGGPSCGCAFACHEIHPASETHCNSTTCGLSGTGNPGGEDNYALARSLNVTLRIDLLQQATQNLMTTAQTTETTDNATYRMSINTFDVGFNTVWALTSDLSAAKTAAGNIAQLEVYSNNFLTAGTNNSDEDTNYDNAMNQVNLAMPNPGQGTAAQGDTPQEVLFFVTDGVEDELVGGGRQESVMDPGWCTTIKNRGIRIAVLYTEYFALPTNSWYNSHVASYQSSIGPTLQSCASPGLYFKVATGGDISGAMSALFQAAVTTAFLSR